MEYKIEQGTVIYGIKSEKYPSFPCYGIIITARCDIAQCKVPKYYYVIGVDATSWFSSRHGYQLVYGPIIEQKKKQIFEKAKALELDGQMLLSMADESIKTIIEDKKKQVAGHKKEIQKIDELDSFIKKYKQIAQTEADDIHRKKAIQSDNSRAVTHIKEIDSGKHLHYYFIPQKAYLDNNVKSRGLIIDFLEIKSLTLEDAEKITKPLSSTIHTDSGIYFSDLPILPTKEELTYTKNLDKIFKKLIEYSRLKNNYWLENNNDFVTIEGTIKSPWCEHLMQRFSNVFTRIGLENPEEDDYKNLIQACYQEKRS